MELKVSSPGLDLDQDQLRGIERDLEKIDRRLKGQQLVYAELRINHTEKGMTTYRSTLELEYGRTHLVATGENSDLGMSVREAREDVLRQINDRSRRGHSDHSKR